MSRILTLQRQARELGRLRTGTFDGHKPVRSNTWVISSHSEEYIEAAAAVWGGKPEKWQPQGNGAQQWRVITTSKTIDAILPPGDPLSQAYEMWNKGGCARRCDGITELLSDNPCVCRAKHGEDFHTERAGTVCNMTTRLNLMLPAMPDIGVWRAETHSFYAANELAGHVDTIRGLVGLNVMVPVRLRIEQRTRVAEGKTKHFPVIALELRGVTTGQVLAIRGGDSGLVQLDGGARPRELTAGPAQPPGQPPAADAVPDYLRAAKAAPSLAQVQEIWNRAEAAGHLTDELRAQLKPIGDALAKAAHERQVAGEVVAAAEQDGDPDELWALIVAKTPDGWTTAFLEQDFAMWAEGVIPADADAATLAGYLAELKAGKR